tara:strand:+ start:319 stop:780 length:462 start_codon:yes stop_codon:yes gene_type:complete
MTIFKDPEDVNFVFYGIIIILAIVGSLFFGKPAIPEHLQSKSKEYLETQKKRLKYHKYLDNELASASKPVVCNHPDTITELLVMWGEKPKMTMNNVSPNIKSELLQTVVVFGMNIETGTWSIVEFVDPDWACILANGIGADVLINNRNMMENE